MLRWAPPSIFTVKNCAERYCIRKYLDLAPLVWNVIRLHPLTRRVSLSRAPHWLGDGDVWFRMSVHTIPDFRIQKFPLWRADSESCGFTEYVWTEAGSAKNRKSCGFKNSRIHVDGGLISKIVVSSSDCRDLAHRESHIPLAWLSVHSHAECNVLDQCAFPHAIIPKIWTKDFSFKVVLMHQPFLATTVGTWRIWRCFWSPWSIAQSVVGLWGVGTLKRTAGRRLRSTATVMTRDPL